LLQPLAKKPPSKESRAAPAKKSAKEKSNAITLPQSAEALGALGRYLACHSHYDTLTPEEKLRCDTTLWQQPDAVTRLTLGVQLPSVWADALAKRRAPFVPMLEPCPLDTAPVNAVRKQLGLGCFTTGY
jgi:hypothetical protein